MTRKIFDEIAWIRSGLLADHVYTGGANAKDTHYPKKIRRAPRSAIQGAVYSPDG